MGSTKFQARKVPKYPYSIALSTGKVPKSFEYHNACNTETISVLIEWTKSFITGSGMAYTTTSASKTEGMSVLIVPYF